MVNHRILISILLLSGFSVILQSFQNHSGNTGNVSYTQQTLFGQISNAGTDKKTNNPERDIISPKLNMAESIIPTMFGSAIGAGFALLGGIWKSGRDRRSAARDVFDVFIEIKKLQILQQSQHWQFYLASKEAVILKCAELMPFIHPEKRDILKSNLKSFLSMTENDLPNNDEKIETVLAQRNVGTNEIVEPLTKYKLQREFEKLRKNIF